MLAVVTGLVVSWHKPPKQRPAEPKEASLIIHTLPGADVRLVGENIAGKASTDGSVSLVVPPGPHQVEVSLDGHETKTEDVSLSAGERHSLRFDLPLAKPQPPSTGNLSGAEQCPRRRRLC